MDQGNTLLDHHGDGVEDNDLLGDVDHNHLELPAQSGKYHRQLQEKGEELSDASGQTQKRSVAVDLQIRVYFLGLFHRVKKYSFLHHDKTSQLLECLILAHFRVFHKAPKAFHRSRPKYDRGHESSISAHE
jgi:hypothetical protein